MPAGEYKVEFSREVCDEEECSLSYYLPQYFEGKSSFEKADPVLVEVGATTEEIDAELEEGGAISGTVTDAIAAPLEEVSVCAYEAGGSGSEPVDCAETDGAGEYTLLVPAGSYKVKFSKSGYTIQYYNGKASFGAANAVSVSTGATHGVIDASLAVAVIKPPVNITAPVLSGTPAVGEVLSCSKGSWENSPTSFAYGWLRDSSPISGQTLSTYTVQTADRGHGISCKVTATNAGDSTAATSNTLQVPPESTPTPTPTPTPSPTPSPLPAAPEEGGVAVAAGVAQVKSGKALVKLTCKGTGACTGIAKLVAGAQIGKASFSIAAGRTKTIAVKLTAKGKKLVSEAGKKGLAVKLRGSGVKPRGLTLKQAG